MGDVTFTDIMDDGSYSAVISCGQSNEYDGRLGIRISSIFVIGFGSMLGALAPVILARSKRMHVPKLTFFIAKFFGSGVIIATAFIHLLAPANEALGSPCLTGPITDYPWPEGISLMTVFVMFIIELMAARFDIFGEMDHKDLESSNPAVDLLRKNTLETGANETINEKKNGNYMTVIRQLHAEILKAIGSGSGLYADNVSAGHVQSVATSSTATAGVQNAHNHGHNHSNVPDVSYPPGDENHLAHHRSHTEDAEHFAAQMTAIFILEFGVIFHSIFIGLTLAVAGEEFNILYIVLSFHQTFEGLGLGSRLATAQWPRSKSWMPYALAIAYGLTTPIAIAIGLGVRDSFNNSANTTMIVNGVFDSISAGILIYTGLVELMAHEFMFNPEMRKANLKMVLGAYSCMCVGAGLMALLGKWA